MARAEEAVQVRRGDVLDSEMFSSVALSGQAAMT
jgi:hypothetical protein